MQLINKKDHEILEFGIIYPGHDGTMLVSYFDEKTGKWERHRDTADKFVPLESPTGKKLMQPKPNPEPETASDSEPCKGSENVRIAKANWEIIVNIVVEQLGVSIEHVLPDTNFVDDLGADSLDLVELWMAFEEQTGLTIPEEEAAKLVSPRLVARWLCDKKWGPFAIPANGSAAAEFLEIQK